MQTIVVILALGFVLALFGAIFWWIVLFAYTIVGGFL